jgi:PTS system nitrogen regulatory IIA component
MLTQDAVVFPLLQQESVLFLKGQSRDEILLEMVNHLKAQGHLADQEAFLKATLAREELVSTGVGLGCAIPHAKLSFLKDFFVCIALIKNPGVDWKAIDKVPVRLVFLIGGPTNEPNRYLKILSAITQAIRSESFRQDLLYCKTAQEVLKLFEPI